jgi:membrane protease subunit (stomatin/prohibitin family)
MGENLDTVLKLPGKYDELSEGLVKRLQKDFALYGLGLSELYVSSITPPPEVQKAIDDKSRLGLFDDLNRLMQMKTAMAMEKASTSRGEMGSSVGFGLGMMMPAMFSNLATKPGSERSVDLECPDCHKTVAADASFCHHCGHHLVVFNRCRQCGKNLTAGARFCSRCGASAETRPEPRKCTHCGAENLPDSVHCNQCGEKI